MERTMGSPTTPRQITADPPLHLTPDQVLASPVGQPHKDPHKAEGEAKGPLPLEVAASNISSQTQDRAKAGPPP